MISSILVVMTQKPIVCSFGYRRAFYLIDQFQRKQETLFLSDHGYTTLGKGKEYSRAAMSNPYFAVATIVANK